MRFEKSTLIATLALALLTATLNAYSATRIEQESEQAAQAYQAKNFQEAASHFQRVVQLDPSNAKAWLFLGQSLAQTNDNMGARKAFAKVLALQSTGQVADRAREQFGKLPDPDLFTMQLESGMTLGDWMPDAESQIKQGKGDEVLGEIRQYLKQFGPVPQLLVMQEKLTKEAQAEQEQKLQQAQAQREEQLNQAISSIKLKDVESAKAALPNIRKLKTQAPENLTLIGLEAKACHLMQDFVCAQTAYAAWLKVAASNDPKRKQMVAGLKSARQHEALHVVKAIRDCEDCPEMVVIPASSFDMGSNNSHENEKPIHRVTIAKSFALGLTEVTQGQWKAIMGNNPSKFGDCGNDCPVENVSWDDAQKYILKLNFQTGKQYRLPSEAEWEYACLAGRSQEYCGSDDAESVAWFSNSSSSTQQSALKQANVFGLYDMSGNVWEWVEDSWHNNYIGAPVDGSAWTDGEKSYRMLRGGSWVYYAQSSHASSRNSNVSRLRDGGYGFRLARTLP